MTFDFLATTQVYLTHLAPLYLALPPEHRGRFYAGRRREVHERAATLGITARGVLPAPDGTPAVVAAYSDLCMAEGRPIAFVEHGAGASYNDNPGYSGGRNRDAVQLFICPSETVAKRNGDRYPHVELAVVGCPALDEWHDGSRWIDAAQPSTSPVVAFTFHWDCPGVPEQGSAFDVFWPHLPAVFAHIANLGGTVLGHSHPRRDLSAHYASQGVEWVPSWADVLDRADLLVFDITSAGYEFASTGRPVVCLDDPSWDQDSGYFPRFALPSSAVGLHCSNPATMCDTIDLALSDPPVVRAARERAVEAVYAYTDGRASERAAEALMAWKVDPTRLQARSGRG